MKTKKIILVIMLMLVALAGTASASLFDDILQTLSIQPQPTLASIPQDPDTFGYYYATQVKPLNTPQNIALLSSEMANNRINIIKVYVKDYGQNFYVVRGSGSVYSLSPGEAEDRTVSLSVNDINKVKEIISDGEISFWERMELWAMIK